MMLKVIDLEPVLYQFGNTEARGYMGFLTNHFAPGAGKFMFFDTWEMLNSPLCPGGRRAVVSNDLSTIFKWQ